MQSTSTTIRRDALRGAWRALRSVAGSLRRAATASIARFRPRHERAAEPRLFELAGETFAVDDATWALLQTARSKPPVVNIQVARTCNLRCSFCSHTEWANPKGFMDYELFTEIIARLRADECTTLIFCSAQGESLLHPRCFDMLRDSLSAGFETNLVTNGTPLNEKRIDELVSLNLASIQFSFCGYDKASYEAAYVGAKFEQVSRNLALLIRRLKEAGSRTAFVINGVVDDKATSHLCTPEDYLARTANYLRSLGADDRSLRLQLPHNWGGTISAGRLLDGKQIYSHRNIDEAPLKMCPILISTPGIYVDGRVTACGCIDANGALEVGDIRKQTLLEIRNGMPYQELLKAFLRRDIGAIPLCNKCEIPYEPTSVLEDVFYSDRG